MTRCCVLPAARSKLGKWAQIGASLARSRRPCVVSGLSRWQARERAVDGWLAGRVSFDVYASGHWLWYGMVFCISQTAGRVGWSLGSRPVVFLYACQIWELEKFLSRLRSARPRYRAYARWALPLAWATPHCVPHHASTQMVTWLLKHAITAVCQYSLLTFGPHLQSILRFMWQTSNLLNILRLS